MNDYHYYIARGRSLEIVQKWRDSEMACRKATAALKAEVGATGAYYQGAHLYGFQFQGDPPEGWKRERRHRQVCTPKGQSKAAKEMRNRMAACTAMSAESVTSAMLGLPFVFGGAAPGGGIRVRSVCLEKIGNDWYIGVPLDGEGKEPGTPPPDALPVKTSEFYRAKEEWTEAQQLRGAEV